MVEIIVFERGEGWSLLVKISGDGHRPPTAVGECWRQKTRDPGLSSGAVCVIVGLAILVELRLVSDRQTQIPYEHSVGR